MSVTVRKAIAIGAGVGVCALAGVATMTVVAQEPDYVENVPLMFTRVTEAPGTSEPGALSSGVRRSDGSWALAWHALAADGTSIETRLIRDLLERRQVLFDTSLRSVTTSYLAEDATQRSARPPVCDGDVVANVLGFDVTRRVTELPYASGERMRIEILLAPALSCFEMERRTVLMERDGSERTVQLERTIDIRPGEPDPAWFKVPEGFVEMSPDQRMRLRHPEMGSDVFVQMWERNYQQTPHIPPR